MAKVFISYARRDYKEDGKEIPNNVVSKVKNALQTENISYWIDESLVAGDEWAQKIPPAILECEVFVFISSQNSNDAYFTKSEVAIAHEYEKHIIPLRIDDTKYNPSIVVHLAGLEHISYYLNPENELKRLVAAIKSYLHELENKAKAEQQELERQKKIKEIDSELRAQYEKKLSLENVISEKQAALSDIESQRNDVLGIIKDLERDKENLNGKSKTISNNAFHSSLQLSNKTGTVEGFIRSIWTFFNQQNTKTKYILYISFAILILLVNIPLALLKNSTISDLNCEKSSLEDSLTIYKDKFITYKDSIITYRDSITTIFAQAQLSLSGEYVTFLKAEYISEEQIKVLVRNNTTNIVKDIYWNSDNLWMYETDYYHNGTVMNKLMPFTSEWVTFNLSKCGGSTRTYSNSIDSRNNNDIIIQYENSRRADYVKIHLPLERTR